MPFSHALSQPNAENMKARVLSLMIIINLAVVGSAQETTPVFKVSSIQDDDGSAPIADMVERVMKKTPNG